MNKESLQMMLSLYQEHQMRLIPENKKSHSVVNMLINIVDKL